MPEQVLQEKMVRMVWGIQVLRRTERLMGFLVLEPMDPRKEQEVRVVGRLELLVQVVPVVWVDAMVAMALMVFKVVII
jgi:hypothetical protein